MENQPRKYNPEDEWQKASKTAREWNTKASQHAGMDQLKKFNQLVITRKILKKPLDSPYPNSYKQMKYAYSAILIQGSESVGMKIRDFKPSEISNHLTCEAKGVDIYNAKEYIHLFSMYYDTSQLFCWCRLAEKGDIKKLRNGCIDASWTNNPDEDITKIAFSSLTFDDVPDFEGVYNFDPCMQDMIKRFQTIYPNIFRGNSYKRKSYKSCGAGNENYQSFLYCNYDTMGFSEDPQWKESAIVFKSEASYNTTFGGSFTGNVYVGNGNGLWQKVKSKETIKPLKFKIKSPSESQRVYSNNWIIHEKEEPNSFTKYYKLLGQGLEYVEHPRYVKPKAYQCDGKPWLPDEDKSNIDSSLSGPIKDLLDKHKKTFYLIGKEDGDSEHKLYLFNLGNVRGKLDKYTHIEKAICYARKTCEWVLESEDDTFTFSKAIEEIDTNFYLLELKKIDKVNPRLGNITHRKANELLKKLFPDCTEERPQGKPNPDDNLQPEWGGGGSDGSGPNIDGGGSGEGYNPEDVKPLPKPEIPNCSTGESQSQTPVSSIRLLKVPELDPSYADTYDFDSKENQEKFFLSRGSLTIENYTYLRKNNAIMVGSHVDNLHCYNYLMYKNRFNKWYYCFILSKEYINESTTRLIIATDLIQTYFKEYTVNNSYVERCHVPRWVDGGTTPTDEFEPEGLEFGEHEQLESHTIFDDFSKTYIAVCSNPLGIIPSRQKKKEE